MSQEAIKLIEMAQENESTSLDLSSLGLHQVPEEIGNLKNLISLDLRRNKLSSLPDSLFSLSKLKTLLLHNNLFDVPIEILGPNKSNQNKNAELILNFLKDLKNVGTSPLNETKLIVVGQGGVGKTSMIRRLLNDTFDLFSEKTDGINIRHWMVSSTDQREVKVNIWDFGGQEIMHATHQFFLTRRSVYVFVLDARIGEGANRVEYWLNVIEQYGGEDAPVLVVVNKIDENPTLSVNESNLKQKFSNIVGFHYVSSKTKEGFLNLKSSLIETIFNVPHVTDRIPSHWLKIKNEIENEKLQKDLISIDSFQALCDENDIELNSRLILLRLLNDLGTIMLFGGGDEVDLINNATILNPEWVTEGVYSLINSREIFQNRGVLIKSDLKQILDLHRYPSYIHREMILEIMEQFELAFPFDSGKRFLIPDLLPATEPEILGFVEALNIEYQYFQFVPAGILSRFIVRHNDKINDPELELWRNGVIIHFENLQALIKLENSLNKIRIAIQGEMNKRRELLAIIRDTFDSIHSGFVRLKVQLRVPLPGILDASVSYRALLVAERESEVKIYVDEIDDFAYVEPLLEGVDGPKSDVEKDIQYDPRTKALRQSISQIENKFNDLINESGGDIADFSSIISVKSSGAQSLEPKVIVDAIDLIVNSEEIIHSQGLFTFPKLKNILAGSNYPNNTSARLFLIEVMELINVIVRLENKSFLIPERLPFDKPEINEDFEGIQIEYNYSEGIHLNILSRLIARYYEYIQTPKKYLWRRGVVLTIERGRVLAEAHNIDNKIKFTFSGYENRIKELIAFIMLTIDEIHSSIGIKKLKGQPLIFVPGNKEASVFYKQVLAHDKHNIGIVYIEEMDDVVPTQSLFTGFKGPKSNKDWSNLLKGIRLDELKNILFNIGIDDEEIQGSELTKSSFVREAIKYVLRRGKQKEFYEEIQNQFPKSVF